MGHRDRPPHRARRPRAQPAERRHLPAAGFAGGVHRSVRVRQVLAGLRHDLRRGPAALRRVAVVLRPAVPRPDGQAGRRLHRGPVPGGVDRPEVDLAQPAVDGRHHHRDLRLPAAAVRPDRPPALPDLRRTDLQADPAADRRPGAGDAGGHPLPGAGAGDPGAQGRVRRPARRPAVQGLLAGPDRRRGAPADRAAEAEEAGEALDRGGRRPAGQPGDRPSSGSPTRWRPACGWPTAWSSSSSSTSTRTTRSANGATPSGWPARTTTRWPSTSWSRGRSRSTRRSAPARSAPGSAPARRSTPSWWCPTASASLAEGAIHPWAGGHHQRVLRPAAAGAGRGDGLLHGHPVGQAAGRTPARRCCTASDEQVHVTYRNRYGRQRSYYAEFEGVIPFLERRAAQTDSDFAREKYEGYMREVPCPVCHGTRLKPEILAVTLAARASVGQLNIADLSATVDQGRGRVLPRPGAVRARPDDRRAGAQGGRRPARLPARRRAGLPVAGPAGGDPVRRRGAADPAGHPDRLRAGRRAVRARRAVDRAAPAGQPPADPDPDPAARPGQHADRRRARRGHHPDRRLGGGHRAGRRRARRQGGGLRHGRRSGGVRRVDHRRVPLRPAGDRGAADAPAGRPQAAS